MESLKDELDTFFRENPGIKPFHLAKAAGVDPSLISAVKNGRKRGCRDDTYKKLAPFFRGERSVARGGVPCPN